MDHTEEARSSSPSPTLREELEGLVRSLFSTTEAPPPKPRAVQEREVTLIPPPPMPHTEHASPKTDGKLDVAEQVGTMLRDLFESQDTFVISNAGVQAIIDGLLQRYRATESAPLREKLLVHWRQDLPRLRGALAEAAKDDPLVLDTGQEVSLVTTQKAQALLERFCPQSVYLPDTRGTRNVR